MKRVISAATLAVAMAVGSTATAHADDKTGICDLILNKYYSHDMTVKGVARVMQLSKDDAGALVDYVIGTECPQARSVSWYDGGFFGFGHW